MGIIVQYLIKWVSACFLAVFAVLIFLSHVHAQEVRTQQDTVEQRTVGEYYRRIINQGTVGILTGSIASTSLTAMADLSAVLDDLNNHTLRVIPMIGKGGPRNLQDLLFLRGVDLAVVPTDVLSYIERETRFKNIRQTVRYITKLYNLELHVIAQRNIKSIRELKGKRVNLGYKNSDTDVTASNAFRTMGIDVKAVHFDDKLGLEKVKSGEIAATVMLIGKPGRGLFTLEPSDNLHLLPIAYEGKLTETYLPSKFTHQDYPALVAKGDTVATLAIGAVLAVYNWPRTHPRYKKVSKFVNTFFERFPDLRKDPRHKKWREVNLNANVQGWTRFAAARDWLKRHQAKQKADRANKTPPDFSQFMPERKSAPLVIADPETERLFRKFLEWRGEQQN